MDRPSSLQMQLSEGALGEPTGVKTAQAMAPYFSDADAASVMGDVVLYKTYGCPSHDTDGEPELLYATTVLNPGTIADEYFMTRGHFHVNPLRGEISLTLSGTGLLVLMDRDRNVRTEAMAPGTINDIDGAWAHRVVNTGDVPLVFYVTWLSDCGHDYEEIEKRGFAARVFNRDGVPATVAV